MAEVLSNNDVFPAGAGMNRLRNTITLMSWGVPRRRGDEPAAMTRIIGELLCSPQARG